MTPLPQRPVSATSPWSWARAIYAVLALTAFCFPGGMLDWLDERNAGAWLAAPLALARGLDAASAALGAKEVGEGLRKWFAQAVGGSDT
ncbi:MAG TPA: hypothetical protein VEF36_15680 [Roseiarcus sp.]|nr:hypothetical protein [Roseiarcus sp.]